MKSVVRTNLRTNLEGRPFQTALGLIQCLVAICVLGMVKVTTASAAPAIVTDTGPLKGTSIFGVQGYLGIPYAVPRVGDLRWTPPQPHGRWHGVFQATQFGNFCTQPSGDGTIGSEDCLTLNVFTPNLKKNADKKNPLPVMVWIHGGGLVTGGSELYDPSPLVLQGNVIVVTINYRLGLLGFFAHPAIDAEGHLNGNYGFMDQQLALNWVQRNIAAFGGDPARVTIFGESAGGQSVYANLASPTAAGLFARAIAESGAYVEFQDYWDFIIPLIQGETIGGPGAPAGTTIASNVGCGIQTAACLRGKSAATIIEQDPGTIYPFVDGTILTLTLFDAFASGKFNQVPVITGGNHDEWRIFVASQYDFAGHPLVTNADYLAAVDALWGAFGPGFVLGIESIYPLSNYQIISPIPGDPSPSPGIALGASGTDGIFACPSRNAARLLSQSVTTYAYEFNDEDAPDLFDPPASFPLGATHGSEIQYLFDFNERFLQFNPFTPAQQQLSNTMVAYWTQFAATGDPNSAGLPVWSPYSIATDELQSLVPPMPMAEATFDVDHMCTELWNKF